MNKIYLDFETYYSKKDFSLKKMSTQDYVTDPQFQVIGCAIAIDDASAVWYAGDAVKAALQAIDWNQTTVIAHDSAFDALILHYIYNVQPAYIACTMNMARASGAFIPDGASLAKLAKVAQDAGHALPSKGNEVIAADGMRLEHFSPAQLEAYASYCRTDVEICRDLYKILRDRVSTGEMIFQSNVVKMYTRPLLVLDAQLLREELTSERARKLELLSRVQQTLQVPNVVEVGKLLSSNPKFAEVLTMFGVAPPMKISKATEKATFAFAKTDAGMVALLEHDDPMVATLAEVRLGTKGSIAETRAERMLEVAPRGPIPMSYTVHGAHTSRLSGGGENLNAQNLPAGRNGQTSNLRRSIMAPPGHQVVVVDSSNLESRVIAYLANSEEKVQAFRDGKDPYLLMASIIYNVGYDALYAAYKAGDADAKQKRQVAKSAELGLQFASGAETFVNYCATVHKVKMDLVTAKGIVDTWRSASANRPITYMWKQAQDVLTHLYRGDSGTFGGPKGKSFVYDGNRIVLDVRVPGVMLPDGVWINYYELTAEPGKFGGPQYKYKQRKQRGADGPELLLEQYIYGGRMVENLVQGTGAAILKHQLNLVADYYPVVMQTHDEVAFLVPDNPGSLAHGLEVAHWAFSQTPDWVAGLPLKGEASHAYRYGDCK
jgi:DNA polymerase